MYIVNIPGAVRGRLHSRYSPAAPDVAELYTVREIRRWDRPYALREVRMMCVHRAADWVLARESSR